MPTKKPTTLTGGKKEIVNIMDKLTGKYSGWQVWQDFVYMVAIMIADQLKGKYYDQREEMYMKHAKSYTADELSMFAEMAAYMIADIDENQEQDFLGVLFMELGLSNSWVGQFFTPYSMAKVMAEMTMGDAETMVKRRGWIGIHDPACGAGVTLLSAANLLKDKGINYQQHVLFVGQDLDELAGLMCYIQLSLLGCAGYVAIGDTLANPIQNYVHRLVPVDSPNVWITPMWYTDVWQERIRWNYVDMVIHPNGKREVIHNEEPEIKIPKAEPEPEHVKPEPIPEPAPEDDEGQLLLF